MDDKFWKHKLSAFLHDAPDKCFDIAGHEASADANQRAVFADESERREFKETVKPADWFSASAERFVFPKVKCSHNFTDTPLFIHPLSSKPYPFPTNFTVPSQTYSETIQAAVYAISPGDLHETFFLYWRRWLDNVSEKTPSLAFLPADTRIPDHTIWNHMSMASALAPCIQGKDVCPEMLLFQLGPVQDFIAAARSTRDLWSGSYLLSWLMAYAMKAVTDRIGPDAVIFPSLRGNGIFDALHRETYYSTRWPGINGKIETTWERLLSDKGGSNKMADWLLTPTLPNRFLAVVPQGEGAELAKLAADALQKELDSIGEAVWKWLEKNEAKNEWKDRWETQIGAFLQIAWATQPWLDRETCLAEAGRLPDKAVGKRLQDFINFAESLPDKDTRYFSAGDGKLTNPGILWSAHYALLDAKLAARRNTRDFKQWNPINKTAAVKDSLTGKEECIGDEKFWRGLAERNGNIFTASSHRYGAMSLIKRLWCRAEEVDYLQQKLGLEKDVFNKSLRADSTQEIARYNDDEENPYIAVLAMDGDEMGKWVSGEKTPKFLKQLAPKANEYLSSLVKKADNPDLRRLLTPSYHLQFSEALSNFAMHKAREIVEYHKGDLIYAGGDDVLAILPSTRAIACAEKLREAFRVNYDDNGRIYPGSRCEVSCGIAVGHCNAPLQMLVKEAQSAESRAKKDYGRAALAVSLYKRSGEIIHWGCKWDGGGNPLQLMRRVTELTREEKLSGRFPYALASLLQPYALEDKNNRVTEIKEIIKMEIVHALSRQGANLSKNEREELIGGINAYLDSLGEEHLGDFINLFLAETFINRRRGEN